MNAKIFLVQTNTSTFRSPGAAGEPRSLAGLFESAHSEKDQFRAFPPEHFCVNM
jgi:hypothetical protein